MNFKNILRTVIWKLARGAAISAQIGCASLDRRMLRSEQMQTKTLLKQRITGVYALYPYKQYEDLGEIAPVTDKSYYRSSYFMVEREELKLDSMAAYQLHVTRPSRDLLRFELRRDTLVVDAYEVGVKFRSDGLGYLKNKEFSMWGVPPFLWGWDHRKTRIGLSIHNDLIIQSAVDGGGMLLFMGSGRSYNSAYGYQRIADISPAY